ncbi:hypothetical protein GCM10009654_57010 [Streptomyces hebeiensis]|uniref:Uncharacterized protein n=2 Tax=Streptomyces hebeiensis TaxID=229486 RepID=A0ABN1V3U1_9ACTN
MRLPKPPRLPGTNGRPPEHGPEFRFAEPETWPEPAVTTRTVTANYGAARAPKPHRPGPGRPPGTRNRRRAPRYDVGKTVRREKTLIALKRLKD